MPLLSLSLVCLSPIEGPDYSGRAALSLERKATITHAGIALFSQGIFTSLALQAILEDRADLDSVSQ